MNGRKVTVSAVSAEELLQIHDEVAKLLVRLGRLMNQLDIEIVSPPLPADVTDLDAYRTARGGAA